MAGRFRMPRFTAVWWSLNRPRSALNSIKQISQPVGSPMSCWVISFVAYTSVRRGCRYCSGHMPCSGWLTVTRRSHCREHGKSTPTPHGWNTHAVFDTILAAMREWTVSEIDTLVALWSAAAAAQIAKRLHRPTGAISGKASRLRREGVLPAGGGAKQYDVTPWPTRSQLISQTEHLRSHRQTRRHFRDNALAMQPCTLIELDAGRCHWPLDVIEAVATMFCGGGAVEPGRRHHHWRD